MPHYLLDTNICSYAIKRKPPELLTKIRLGLAENRVCISVITKAELLYGLELVPEATTLQKAVFAFLENTPCFDWTSQAAEHYAKIQAMQKRNGSPTGYMDTLIAAHALARKLTLVTNNERHFIGIPGLEIENWVGAGQQ